MRLIFTDLDGSLLDHSSYSFAPAAGLLDRLAEQLIPVIPVTSKTCAEVLSLRKTLNNSQPFIVENGAAIYLPKQYFEQCPKDANELDDYWVIANSPPRSHWLQLLDEVGEPFAGEYQTFSSICADEGTTGLAKFTGLTSEQAALAQQREYSEPIHWLGSADRKVEFSLTLTNAGAHLLQGGRFLTMGGDTNKGRALLHLQGLYQQKFGACQSLAIGDSGNDISMLEVADSALIIRSENHSAPVLQRTTHFHLSKATGPNGWVEGVTAWLATQY